MIDMAELQTVPATLNWTAYAGDRNEAYFYFTGGNDPLDITGAVIEAQVRATAGDPVVEVTATVQITEPALGQFTLSWDGEELRAVLGATETWSGVWDCQLTLPPEPLPRSLFGGKFTILHDVTRSGL